MEYLRGSTQEPSSSHKDTWTYAMAKNDGVGPKHERAQRAYRQHAGGAGAQQMTMTCEQTDARLAAMIRPPGPMLPSAGF